MDSQIDTHIESVAYSILTVKKKKQKRIKYKDEEYLEKKKVKTYGSRIITD